MRALGAPVPVLEDGWIGWLRSEVANRVLIPQELEADSQRRAIYDPQAAVVGAAPAWIAQGSGTTTPNGASPIGLGGRAELPLVHEIGVLVSVEDVTPDHARARRDRIACDVVRRFVLTDWANVTDPSGETRLVRWEWAVAYANPQGSTEGSLRELAEVTIRFYTDWLI